MGFKLFIFSLFMLNLPKHLPLDVTVLWSLMCPVDGSNLNFIFNDFFKLMRERACILQVAWRSLENARGQNNLVCSSLFHLRCPREYLFAGASAAAVDTDDFH